MKHSILFGFLSILISSFSYGAIPQLINYQGLLLEENGTKVTGIKAITLKVFTGATDGNGTKEITGKFVHLPNTNASKVAVSHYHSIYLDVYKLDLNENLALTENYNPFYNTKYDTSIKKQINGLQIKFI
mgnify:CR=1 FL=1